MITKGEIHLLIKLEQEGIQFGELLEAGFDNDQQAFLDWCDTLYKNQFIQDIYPWMGEDDGSTEYEGQPVIWDGCLVANEQGIIYSGNTQVSGMGANAFRYVKPTDTIIALGNTRLWDHWYYKMFKE